MQFVTQMEWSSFSFSYVSLKTGCGVQKIQRTKYTQWTGMMTLIEVLNTVDNILWLRLLKIDSCRRATFSSEHVMEHPYWSIIQHPYWSRYSSSRTVVIVNLALSQSHSRPEDDHMLASYLWGNHCTPHQDVNAPWSLPRQETLKKLQDKKHLSEHLLHMYGNYCFY